MTKAVGERDCPRILKICRPEKGYQFSACGRSKSHSCRDVQGAVINVELNTHPKKGIRNHGSR